MGVIDEVKDASINDLEIIIETQKDLYTVEEMEEIKDYYNKKILAEKFSEDQKKKDRLPKTIICPKCAGPNDFSEEKCCFCGYKLDKEIYYKDEYYDNDDDYENDETPKNSGNTFQYVISFLIPLFAYVYGAIMISKDNEEDRRCGKDCILISLITQLVISLISVVIVLISVLENVI